MNDELVYGTEPTYRKSAVWWALLVTFGAGMVWGAASGFTGWRLAWLAPGVAVVIALAWKPAAYEPKAKTAAWAVFLVFLAAGVALGTAKMVGNQHVSGRELRQDPGLLQTAVRDWMYAHNEIPDPSVEIAPGEQRAAPADEIEVAVEADTDDPVEPESPEDPAETPEEADAPEAPPVRTEVLVRQRIANMDAAGQRDIVAWYVRQPGGQASRQSTATRAWRIMDAVWLLAASWLAFRLASPGPSAEDE